MSYHIMDAYFLIMIILYLCIGQGDGHWKEKERENLRHDIELHRKMAEKIEREIESFYDEYPEERYKGDNVDRIHYKHVIHKLDRKTETEEQRELDKIKRMKNEFLYEAPRNTSNDNISQSTTNTFSSGVTTQYGAIKNTINSSKSSKFVRSSWPKFEDILNAMGKRYDWKNDRWIKVKEKTNKEATRNNEITPNNSSEFHEKHKFSYRIVKLSKSKSRRNVVVAVSAVR